MINTRRERPYIDISHVIDKNQQDIRLLRRIANRRKKGRDGIQYSYDSFIHLLLRFLSITSLKTP